VIALMPLILLFFPGFGLAAQPRSSEGVRFLAADTTLHAELDNARLEMGQAEFIGKVLELDQSWEKRDFPFGFGYCASVLIDGEGRWRMYYELMKHNAGRCTAVAFSDDGGHRTKPALNLTEDRYTTANENNIVNVLDTEFLRGGFVFLDERVPADRRFRMSWRYGGQMSGAVSADGLNFRNVGTVDTGGSLDSLNVTFYDSLADQRKETMS
jgi:hypothetical protein